MSSGIRNKRMVLILFSISCVYFYNGCKSGNSNDNKLKFYYYPANNIYYDVARGNYLYSLNGGKTWDSLHLKTEKENEELGERKVVYNDTHDIWKSNNAHLQSFNGVALNIAGYGLGNELTAKDEVVERKMVRRTTAPGSVEREKKEKKGLGRLINNIFGKKKKKD